MAEDVEIIAVVSGAGEGAELAGAYGIEPDAVQEFVIVDEDGIDRLQDLVYENPVSCILLDGPAVLPVDVMTQEMVLAGWRERGIEIRMPEQQESEDRRRARDALDEIDQYGKIPWVP